MLDGNVNTISEDHHHLNDFHHRVVHDPEGLDHGTRPFPQRHESDTEENRRNDQGKDLEFRGRLEIEQAAENR